MKISQATSLLLASALTMALTACGSTSRPPTFDATSLEGNWSLFGPLPSENFGLSPYPGNGMALTMDVIGNQLIASVSDQFACGEFSTGQNAVLLGTLNSDGTFTLSQQTLAGAPQPFQLQIVGKASSTPGAAWSGTYTYTAPSSSCTQPFTGAFGATPIQPLSGTYNGSTTAFGSSSPNVPITIAATLTQGATVPGSSPAAYKASAITGSITVSGVSCFTSGTSTSVTTLPFSALEGNFVELNFTMDDGSVLTAFGYEQDLAASKLNILLLSDLNGKCQFQSAGQFELSK